MTTSRSVVFTLNNYTEEEYKAITEWECKYLVVGKEVGENKTPHLQGYVEWRSPKRFEVMKKLLPRAHWEKRRGTAKQASDYCKKDGDFIEIGQMSKQGERNDIHDFVDKLKAGKRMREVAEEDPVTFIKFNKGLKAYQTTIAKDRQSFPYIEWRYGVAGVGKTYGVYMKHGNENIYSFDGKWWDGYENDKVILMDDLDPTDWKEERYKEFLKICDRYKYMGQIKGGYTKIDSPYIYITAEKHPFDYWQGNKLHQVLRRMARVVQVTDGGVEEDMGVENGGSKVAYPGDLADMDDKHIDEPEMQPDPVAEHVDGPEAPVDAVTQPPEQVTYVTYVTEVAR